ncbi:MAG: hypothetical protein PHT12_03190 [Patescibacteria group bacterium]|nr:hypothetical protein [Patescibacteria group bacterium]
MTPFGHDAKTVLLVGRRYEPNQMILGAIQVVDAFRAALGEDAADSRLVFCEPGDTRPSCRWPQPGRERFCAFWREALEHWDAAFTYVRVSLGPLTFQPMLLGSIVLDELSLSTRRMAAEAGLDDVLDPRPLISVAGASQGDTASLLAEDAVRLITGFVEQHLAHLRLQVRGVRAGDMDVPVYLMEMVFPHDVYGQGVGQIRAALPRGETQPRAEARTRLLS